MTTIKEGNLKDRWLVQVDISYHPPSNEYMIYIRTEKGKFNFGVPRHRMKDMMRSFNDLIEEVDRTYPEE